MNASPLRTFMTSILVPDRVGLLRDVTQAVFSMEGNIGAIRQTTVDGFFSLVFTSDHPAEVSAEALKRLLGNALEDDAVVTVLDKKTQTEETPVTSGPRFIVMTRGRDKPGTICAITSFLVEHNINIEDWMVEEEDGEIIYIAQVVVPESIDFRKAQEEFRAQMNELDLTGLLCHENIFRATNEIGPIKPLIG
jgi:glycine cleavage system transcriptional repressor